MASSKQIKICRKCKKAFKPTFSDSEIDVLNEREPEIGRYEVDGSEFHYVRNFRGGNSNYEEICGKCTTKEIEKRKANPQKAQASMERSQWLFEEPEKETFWEKIWRILNKKL